MTHEEMSLHTRQAMTGSLKKFMGLKPLSQITVSEICADCNLNRKTFYYHFEIFMTCSTGCWSRKP